MVRKTGWCKITGAAGDEKGNVLFLILIAVALFAALSYAVTQSTRDGGDSTEETALINTAQLIQYPTGIRNSILRMRISGVTDSELEFNPPSNFASLTSSNVAVFHPSGGGATYTLAPGALMANGNPVAWVYNAQNQIDLIGTTNLGGPDTSTVDVVAFLVGISTSICQKVNQELGLPKAPVSETGIDVTTLMEDGIGICDGGCDGTIGDEGTNGDTLEGKAFGCFSQGGQNIYFHALIER